MKQTIILTGQVRGGKNNMGVTKKGKHYPKKLFKEWRDEAVMQVFLQKLVRLTVPCSMDIVYTTGDKKKRDIPAILDAIFHVLERAGVVDDDSLIENVNFKKFYDKENPNVRMTIWKK